MVNSKTLAICILILLECASFFGCSSKQTESNDKTSEIQETYNEENNAGIGSRLLVFASKDTLYINSVKGHEEKDTIIGNFTGSGIDTLYVESVVDCNCNLDKDYDEEEHFAHEMDDELVKYYLTSTNPVLGKVELFGYASLAPRLVNEGDLDGNGTCEVGYLPVWRLSQWRLYHLFTFKDGKWKYLIDPEADVKDANGGESLFETGHLLRGSGFEIATPSGRKGLVMIRYQTQGVNSLIKDTLVTPDYKDIIP